MERTEKQLEALKRNLSKTSIEQVLCFYASASNDNDFEGLKVASDEVRSRLR